MAKAAIVRYGSTPAQASSAAGVRGVLCRSINGEYFFRVTADDGSFTDYELFHDDLEVTISETELASFYCVGDRRILDHSPTVLGLEVLKSDGVEQGA